MNYAISDLHGYSPLKLARLLKKVNFSENDTLYILGDVIDRGNYGIQLLSWVSGVDKEKIFSDYLLKIGAVRLTESGEFEVLNSSDYELIKYLVKLNNVKFILGNHEHMMLEAAAFLGEITVESCDAMSPKDIEAMSRWGMNGNAPTIDGIRRLQESGRQQRVTEMLDFLREAPRYLTVETENGEIVLVHAGLGNFSPDKPLSAYSDKELVWMRPKLNAEYFEDKLVVFGHTPTITLAMDSAYKGKVVKRPTWLCIDVGCAGGFGPALVCLDSMSVCYGELHTDFDY